MGPNPDLAPTRTGPQPGPGQNNLNIPRKSKQNTFLWVAVSWIVPYEVCEVSPQLPRSEVTASWCVQDMCHPWKIRALTKSLNIEDSLLPYPLHSRCVWSIDVNSEINVRCGLQHLESPEHPQPGLSAWILQRFRNEGLLRVAEREGVTGTPWSFSPSPVRSLYGPGTFGPTWALWLLKKLQLQ